MLDPVSLFILQCFTSYPINCVIVLPFAALLCIIHCAVKKLQSFVSVSGVAKLLLILMCSFPECPMNDILCERDWIGYEAVAQLHARIDDDKNGGLDRLESDEVTVVESYVFIACCYQVFRCFHASCLHICVFYTF